MNYRLFHSLRLAYPPPAAASLPDLFAALTPQCAAGSLDEHRLATDAAPPTLFRSLRFFLGRETNSDALSLLILSCGGSLAAAQDEEGVTHCVLDRGAVSSPAPGMAYVQPQWLFDSLNLGIRCPEPPYAPGVLPPPHLSPFVDASLGDAHVPDVAETHAAWQAAARGEELAALGGEGDEKPEEAGEDYAAGLEKEFRGVPYSVGGAGMAPSVSISAAHGERRSTEGEEEKEAAQMAHVLLPRKQKELYKAMQMGRAKRAEKAAGLARKKKAAA